MPINSMKIITLIIFIISFHPIFTFASFNKCTNESDPREGILIKIAAALFKLSKNYLPPSKFVKAELDTALAQYKLMASNLQEGVLPRSGFLNGSVWTSGPEQWTCGFYIGTFWYLFEYSKANWTSIEAKKRMLLIQSIQYQTTTHDVGFKMFPTFGHAYQLEKNTTAKEEYSSILLQSASSLATRFKQAVGCIRSWDWGGSRWNYPVIIDNMMNLELLNWASMASGNCTFMQMAISHANRTIANHFRPDFSSFHVVDFNSTNGAVRRKLTYQGYADWSSWARGQAWGLYGFTMMFRYTGLEHYLNQAINIANFILTSSKVPSDGIPFWDYDVPVNDTTRRKRDASAAAITASALLELGQHVAERFELFEAIRYWSMSTKIIATLKSEEYRTKLRENITFLLKHSVGNFPTNTEVDVPIVYADYYFVEAIMRYKKLFS